MRLVVLNGLSINPANTLAGVALTEGAPTDSFEDASHVHGRYNLTRAQPEKAEPNHPRLADAYSAPVPAATREDASLSLAMTSCCVPASLGIPGSAHAGWKTESAPPAWGSEIWHFAVLAGALFHWRFVWSVVNNLRYAES